MTKKAQAIIMSYNANDMFQCVHKETKAHLMKFDFHNQWIAFASTRKQALD